MAVNRIFGAISITGTTGALQSIDVSVLSDKDIAIVRDDTQSSIHFYTYNRTSTAAEDIPLVVLPSGIPDGRWHMISPQYFMENIIVDVGNKVITNEMVGNDSGLSIGYADGDVDIIVGDLNITVTKELTTNQTIYSTLVNGTAPIHVDSTTICPNLNVQYVGGLEGIELITRDGLVTFTGVPALDGTLDPFADIINNEDLTTKSYVDTVVASQAAIDHGDLVPTSLLDDDHTHYMLVDGTRAFNNIVSFPKVVDYLLPPTADAHLTTKYYVDQEIQTIVSGNGIFLALDGTNEAIAPIPYAVSVDFAALDAVTQSFASVDYVQTSFTNHDAGSSHTGYLSKMGDDTTTGKVSSNILTTINANEYVTRSEIDGFMESVYTNTTSDFYTDVGFVTHSSNITRKHMPQSNRSVYTADIIESNLSNLPNYAYLSARLANLFQYSSTTPLGMVQEISVFSGGMGYTLGTYEAVPQQNINGTGLIVDVTVDNNGTITSVNVNTPGLNYRIGDVVYLQGGYGSYKVGDTVTIDGGVTPATLTIDTISEYGKVLTFTITDGGTGYVDGVDITTTPLNSSGSGFTVDIVDGGTTGILETGEVTVNNDGDGDARYKVGDTLTIDGTVGTPAEVTVLTVGGSGKIVDYTVTNQGTLYDTTSNPRSTATVNSDGIGFLVDINTVGGGGEITDSTLNVGGLGRADLNLKEVVMGASHHHLVENADGDDHTQYIHINSSRAFDNSVNYPRVTNSLIIPTLDEHLITKAYFDSGQLGSVQADGSSPITGNTTYIPKYPYDFFSNNADNSDDSIELVPKSYVDDNMGKSLCSINDRHFAYLGDSITGNTWYGFPSTGVVNNGVNTGIRVDTLSRFLGSPSQFSVSIPGGDFLNISTLPINSYPQTTGSSSTSSTSGMGLLVDTIISDGVTNIAGIMNAGNGEYVAGQHVSVVTIATSGTGDNSLTVDVSIDNGLIVKVLVSTGGTGYDVGDTFTFDDNDLNNGVGTGTGGIGYVVEVLNGSVTGVTINDGGTGYSITEIVAVSGVTPYVVGDVVTVDGGTSGTLTITAVDSYGGVLTFDVTTGGTGYSTGTQTTSGGTGSGFTVDIVDGGFTGVLEPGEVTVNNKGNTVAQLYLMDVVGGVVQPVGVTIVNGGSGYVATTSATTTGTGYPSFDMTATEGDYLETSVVLDEVGVGTISDTTPVHTFNTIVIDNVDDIGFVSPNKIVSTTTVLSDYFNSGDIITVTTGEGTNDGTYTIVSSADQEIVLVEQTITTQSGVLALSVQIQSNNIIDGVYRVKVDGNTSGMELTLDITFTANNISDTVVVYGGYRFQISETITVNWDDFSGIMSTMGSVTYTVATTTNNTTLTIIPLPIGSIGVMMIKSSGYGYAVNDNIIITGNGDGVYWQVDSVGPNGEIAGVRNGDFSLVLSGYTYASVDSINSTFGVGAVLVPYIKGSIYDLSLSHSGTSYLLPEYRYSSNPADLVNDGYTWNGSGTTAGDTDAWVDMTITNPLDERMEFKHFNEDVLSTNISPKSISPYMVTHGNAISGITFDKFGHVMNIYETTVLAGVWETKMSDFEIEYNKSYLVDMNTAGIDIVVTLPPTMAVVGDTFVIDDYRYMSSIWNIIVETNDNNNLEVEGSSVTPMVIDVDGSRVMFTYVGTDMVGSYGWRYKVI